MYIFLVGLFGVMGASLRYLIGIWTESWMNHKFPLGTLLINLGGALFLGWFSTWTYSNARFPSWLKVSLGTGLVGSFTTFSTFSVETTYLLKGKMYFVALLYVLLSSVGGVLSAWFGFQIYRKSRKPKERYSNS